MRNGLAVAVITLILGFATAPTAISAPIAQIAIVVPGQGQGPDTYLLLAKSLEIQGYQAHVLNVAGRDLVAEANIIASRVDSVLTRQRGATVSLIGHSVGGLSARYYLKMLRGSDRVSNYVAIGTPQYGVAPHCPGDTRRDTCFRSNFMQTLNAGSDTPGLTRYYSIRGEREYSDGRLDDGQCRLPAIPAIPGTDGGIEHGIAPYNPLVWSAVSSALSGGCPGTYVVDHDNALAPESTIRPSFPN